MNRREIPRIEMFDYGQEYLRRQGFVAMPFLDSLSLDPARLSPHFNDFYQVSLMSGDCGLMHDFRKTDVDAKRMLLHSGLSVSEIGYRLGFKDPSHFSR